MLHIAATASAWFLGFTTHPKGTGAIQKPDKWGFTTNPKGTNLSYLSKNRSEEDKDRKFWLLNLESQIFERLRGPRRRLRNQNRIGDKQIGIEIQQILLKNGQHFPSFIVIGAESSCSKPSLSDKPHHHLKQYQELDIWNSLCKKNDSISFESDVSS